MENKNPFVNNTTVDIDKMLKNAKLDIETIIFSYFKGDITKEEASELIRISRCEIIELDDKSGWFDINSASIYKEIDGIFTNRLLKTRKGTIIYEYFGKEYQMALTYGYKIPTEEELKMFENVPEHMLITDFSEREL